ncbi:MAG: fused MFS/spermidine synthase [bacterium]|nr:fused MFS/spermidine synthase [bacterium]
MSNAGPVVRTLFLLFTLSGFSGLIYESIWSHYLQLILGHAAYAQTLVLAIFMGGMTLGAGLASRYSERCKTPLIFYAWVEGGVGLMALAFHTVFVFTLDTLYEHLIPALGTPVLIHLVKWGIASVLILPQSILLGTTFPLMSAGMIRLHRHRTGATLGLLYFANSIGAAVGVLVSGFVLIPRVGLPGTIFVVGILNLLVALVTWGLVWKREAASVFSEGKQVQKRPDRVVGVFLFSALLTGTASFCYEIGWIRMLSLVLSSTTQAFELMLSAFISGLALGGLWIRRRLDGIATPLRYAGHVQIGMGVLALLTLPLYSWTFDAMAFLLGSLSRTDGGYFLFNLGSHAIALGVMLPATFMAGMTLPLFTYGLLKHGYGEASIGQVYAANTVGAIVGILLATHLVMPVMGVQGLVHLGAFVDIALGIGLLVYSLAHIKKWELGVGLGGVVLVGVMFGVVLDPLKMASGVYRYGTSRLPDDSEVIYHRDGKTATVHLVRNRIGNLGISTNGKLEASVNPPGYHVPAQDEITMVMAAALPLALHPGAKRAANIGMGSGMTAHALLGTTTLQRVDTVEIEAAVVEAARRFGPFVERVYTDGRSHIHIDDAKAFFSNQQVRYDIIISEPSDPWVSGVAGLFSREFYGHIKRYLQEDGLLVQWLNLYETNLDLVSSVFQALSSQFPNYVVFNTSDSNLLIVASVGRDLEKLDPWIFRQDLLRRDMERVGLTGLQDLAVRRMGSRALLQPLFDSFDVPANSDYFPYLSSHAPRSRFLNEDAGDLSWMHLAPVPVLEMLGGGDRARTHTYSTYFSQSNSEQVARQLLELVRSGTVSGQGRVTEKLYYSLRVLNHELRNCSQQMPDERVVRESLHLLAIHTNPYLSPEDLGPMWDHLKERPCYAKLSAQTQTWFALHRAVAQRDGGAMTDLSSQLIEGTVRGRPEQVEYLLGAGLVGAFSEGGAAKARLFWAKFGRLTDGFETAPPFYFELLVSLL